MVCDRESKAFNVVENIFSDHCTVEKLDCVGHLQKWMKKDLKNL